MNPFGILGIFLFVSSIVFTANPGGRGTPGGRGIPGGGGTPGGRGTTWELDTSKEEGIEPWQSGGGGIETLFDSCSEILLSKLQIIFSSLTSCFKLVLLYFFSSLFWLTLSFSLAFWQEGLSRSSGLHWKSCLVDC